MFGGVIPRLTLAGPQAHSPSHKRKGTQIGFIKKAKPFGFLKYSRPCLYHAVLVIKGVSVKCRVQVEVGRWVKGGTRSAGALHFPQRSSPLGKMHVGIPPLNAGYELCSDILCLTAGQSVIIHFRVLLIYCQAIIVDYCLHCCALNRDEIKSNTERLKQLLDCIFRLTTCQAVD